MRVFLAALLLCPVLALAQGAPPRVTGGSVTAANSGALGPLINLRAPGRAAGNAAFQQSCSILASSNTLTCSGASFTTTLVGQTYYLQGTGASGVPQVGTISAVPSSTTLTLSLNAVQAAPTYGIFSAGGQLSLATAGSGCTANTTGTLSGTGTPASVTINTVTGGAVQTWTWNSPGAYTAYPGTTYNFVGGTCSGVTFTGSGAQTSGQLITCTDDTTAITIAAAAAAGGRLHVPAGGYCLSSQGASIALTNTMLEGDGAQSYGAPYFNHGGSWFLIFDQSTAAFTLNSGVTVADMGFYYPVQDDSQTTPVAFPPLFQAGTSNPNTNFHDMRIANGYDCFYTPTNGGWGRVSIENNRMFCADKYIWMLNGQADVTEIGTQNYFGQGASDNLANIGPAYLSQYAASNSTLFYVDLSNAGYKSIDGLHLNKIFLQGARYGVRLLGTAGVMDVSVLDFKDLDSVQTALSVEGSTSIISTSLYADEVYSINVFVPTAANPIINLHGLADTSDLNIKGMQVAYAQGDVIDDYGSMRRLAVQGGQWKYIGRSTTLSAYAALHSFDNSGSTSSNDVILSGIDIDCGSTSLTTYGILDASDGSGSNVEIQNNVISNCLYPVVLQGYGGTQFFGNNRLWGNTAGLNDSTGGGTLVTYGINSLDHLPATRTPTASFGTGATVASGSTNEAGSITIGTGTVTTGTMTFTTALPYARFCRVGLNSSSVIPAITANSTTALTVGFSASAAGLILTYSCPP